MTPKARPRLLAGAVVVAARWLFPRSRPHLCEWETTSVPGPDGNRPAVQCDGCGAVEYLTPR